MEGGDDQAGPMETHLPVVIDGGSGRDTYTSRNPSFLTNVKFNGGSGVEDAVTYAGSGGSGGGRGVRITNDGVANDGRIGLDTDNVGRDVEKLIGSAHRDEITANGPLDFAVTGEFAHTEVQGFRGDDILRVGADGGLGVTIRSGVADGADQIIGGAAASTVDYSDRTRPVTATLNFGGADDGEAGEGDQIAGGHELILGGQAGDVLRAPPLSTAAHAISGGSGNDTIDGGEGKDSLTGGADGDTLRGLGGDDRIFAKDGERDTVDCGLQTDTFDVDSIDNFGNCENGTVGVLRLAPKALRVEAGETARLRLSWRHPRSWRQLRRIELRVYRGGARVGAVAIRPRGKRIEADGAVRLASTASHLAHKGKTVSVRLALRLAPSLAGERLQLEVAAVDRGGVEQLERRAGSVRVAG